MKMNVKFLSIKVDQLPWCRLCEVRWVGQSTQQAAVMRSVLTTTDVQPCPWINRSDVHLVHFSPRYNKNGHGAFKSSIVTANKLTMNVIKLISIDVYQS